MYVVPTGRGAAGQSINKAVLRLSSTRNSYRHLNSKLIARDLKSVSNIVPIRETYFELSERHNPNIGIFFSGNPFAEMIFFWVWLLEKMSNMY